MLSRKIACCVSLFAFLLMLGWGLEQSVSRTSLKQRLEADTSAEELRFRSATSAEPVPLSVPFLPRQYVRIISTDK